MSERCNIASGRYVIGRQINIASKGCNIASGPYVIGL